MYYTGNYTATCPKCDAGFTQADFICKNCERGEVHAYADYKEYYDYKAEKIKTRLNGLDFACSRCGMGQSRLHCKKCNTQITPKFIYYEQKRDIIDILTNFLSGCGILAVIIGGLVKLLQVIYEWFLGLF